MKIFLKEMLTIKRYIFLFQETKKFFQKYKVYKNEIRNIKAQTHEIKE
jgi:hypothetical protein